ncbi:hypothetical protein ACA910_006030 [Epithemia clementina (nom. ined.)]
MSRGRFLRIWFVRIMLGYLTINAGGLLRRTWRAQNLAVNASTTAKTSYKTVQVQVVHRHGDRTPITPLEDVDYWQEQLVPPDQLERIALDTKIVRSADSSFTHDAGGKGAFGKLTRLGLFQMVDVGVRLGEDLTTANRLFYSPLFGVQQKRLLTKRNVMVLSTDFPRTIQSVQGLLVGLFDKEDDKKNNGDWSDIQEDDGEPLEIDVRHTEIMIPDPQPRATKEQERLEAMMMSRPRVSQREAEHLELAARVSQALHPLLGPGAHEITFGVDETQHPETMSVEMQPLAWNQLAEITKCLQIRNRLPLGVSDEDVEAIGKHTAWRWIETLSHPRLIYLAMHKMLSKQVNYMSDYNNQPPLILWSGHDSTLLGLLSAYRLEQPSAWPAYASVLAMEVIEKTIPSSGANGPPTTELVVRFSLNGERLRSMWDPEHPLDAIPLSLLAEKIRTEGSEPSRFAHH